MEDASKKSKEDLLIESNKLLSLFIEHSPIFTYIKEVNAEGSRVLYASENFQEMIGIPGSQMVGKTMYELFPPELAAQITADDQAVIAGGQVLRRDEDLDGHSYTTIKYPITSNDATLLAGYTIEITERKKVEEALRKSQEQFVLAMDATSEGLWDWDIQTNVVYYSPGYFRILGFEPNEFDPSIDSWLSLTHPDDLDRVVRENEDCINNVIQTIHVEYRMKSKDGSWRWILARGKAVVRGSDGKALRMVGVHEDITDRKLANEDLVKAKERAEESDRLKSAFLANMSHEIRTPMNGILGFAELLKNPDLAGEKGKEYIDIIQKSGERMLNIINDIIDLSKIEAGQMNVAVSEVNINDLIDDVYSFFIPEVEKKGIRFLCQKACSDADAFIYTDQEKAFAVLVNLVKNAVKFTSKGSISYGYEVLGNDVQFYVRDTGPGISPEQQTIIFERFRQGSELHSRNFEGSGLGLTISKAYVELLGGRIWLTSEEGKGSAFYFTLPDMREAGAQADLIENVAGIPIEKPSRGLKILIAEDDDISRKYLLELTEGYSHEVFCAGTGVEAVEICRAHSDLDAVFMDLKMPIMDGLEATRQIRQFNQHVCIIAQTAYALSGDKEKALDAGCTDYLPKPISRAQLALLLSKHFGAIF